MSDDAATQRSIEDLELEIKQLDRDKRIEEIRQLKASGKRQWITPAALALLLPVVAGFGLWLVEEVKQFNAGYAALNELDRLNDEKAALVSQKDSLNLDVMALLDLRRLQKEQADALQAQLGDIQRVLDGTFLLARFYAAEIQYALGHVSAPGLRIEEETLDRLKQEVEALAPESSEPLLRLIEDYRLAIDLVDDSRQQLAAINQRLDGVAVSAWARDLEWMPRGMILGRSLMVADSEQDGAAQRRFYDVDEGRFLSEEEAREAQ